MNGCRRDTLFPRARARRSGSRSRLVAFVGRFQPAGLEFQDTANERMWIAAAQFQNRSAKFDRNRLMQVFTFFAPCIQSDFKFEQIGRNLIGHNISSRNNESFAPKDKRRRTIRHDGLPKGDGNPSPFVLFGRRRCDNRENLFVKFLVGFHCFLLI